MRKIFVFFSVAMLSMSSFCNAQDADEVLVKRIVNEVMTNSTAHANLRKICKDIGPRLSGSLNAQRAIEATAQMLRDAGADKVYLQPCMVTHWERGAKETGFIKINGKKTNLQLTALGNSEGSGKKAVQGSIVEVASMEALHELGNAVKGKIVFFNIKMNPTHIETFRAYSESGIGRRSGPAQAAKYGAVGVFVRSLASNIDEYPHTGVTQYNDSFPKIPAVAISTLQSEMISKALSAGNIVSGSFKTNCRMLPDVLSYNVIGEIVGSTMPNEIITVGGHLDSWDLAEGANDDGTGCVQSIEVIRSFKALGLKPERTIRAVMFMNEENGGGGGDAYYDSAVSKKENHLLAIESDAGGFTPRYFGIKGTKKVIDKLNGWAYIFKPYGIQSLKEGSGGSDIENLAKLGTTLVGFTPDSQRYFDIHHAATDVFENVSKRELDLGAANITALIYLVSKYGL